MSPRHALRTVALATVLLVSAGCSHPAAWFSEPHVHIVADLVGPTEVTGYDTDRDERIDYLQVFDTRGVKRRLLFDTTGDGTFDLTVDLDRPDTERTRTLVFLLDGVTFDLVADLWAEGHFRLFHPPGRLIPGFPTVTDTIYADFFETPRPFGVEGLYYDASANKLIGGNDFYLKGGNEPVWPHRLLYRQNHAFDGLIYVLPDWVAGRELDKSIGAAIHWLEKTDDPYAAIYVVSTDGLAHKQGHESLKRYLLRVDEAIEQLVWRSRGRLRVICMADHALNEAPMKRADVPGGLKRAGFRPAERIKDDCDVVVPGFGLISSVSIYTRCPAEVAAAAALIEGVELAIYPQAGAFAVASADGMARVETDAAGRYRYVASRGDPLRLLPVIETLKTQGKADRDGWAGAADWLDATWDHDFPDPLVRIAKAFAVNVRHPPDVLLSLAPEYFCGEEGFESFATLRGTHGSLRRCATTTFVLSNFFVPPHHLRTTELRDLLKQEHLHRPTLLPDE